MALVTSSFLLVSRRSCSRPFRMRNHKMSTHDDCRGWRTRFGDESDEAVRYGVEALVVVALGRTRGV